MIKPDVPVGLLGSGAAEITETAATARTINTAQVLFRILFIVDTAPLGFWWSVVPMHRIGREGRQANRNVFSAPLFRGTVLNPFPAMRNDGLPSAHLEGLVSSLDAKHALQNNRELIKLRFLTRLYPTCRTLHACNAGRGGLAVHAANVLLDDLRLVAGGLDYCG